MRAISATAASLLLATPALGARPVDGQINFQPAATPVMEQVHAFHVTYLMPVITVISVFVMLLLLYVMLRFNKAANPTPKSFTHNTLLEVLWTGIPVLILIVIAVPSFRLLYYQDRLPEHDLTIKTVGYQWYWGYEYPDDGGFDFSSYMLTQDQVADSADYLLAVDAPMVAPAGKTVRLLVTAADVIHNWAMPAFGIKMDAVPGRVNEVWFRVDEPGTYYGQCSELCGRNHAFMPIQVEIVPEPVYAQWTSAKSGGDDEGASRVLATYKSSREDAVKLADAR
ncbi:MAG: cytochrome c oxidase subunit II [Caulobacterales bacterium]|nr:cytochrome c oxidase subunit II [Caulobacterales bacterium]